jgi:hypothetical protein
MKNRFLLHCLALAALTVIAGCQATGQKIGEAVASGSLPSVATDKARIYVYRETAEYGGFYAPIVYINDRSYHVVRPGGVYIYEVTANQDFVFHTKGGGGMPTTGTFHLNLKPGEERFFEATYSTYETLSSGTKTLSVILSGDSGTKRSFSVDEVKAETAQEKMKNLSLASLTKE